jgi:hypothetical protein
MEPGPCANAKHESRAKPVHFVTLKRGFPDRKILQLREPGETVSRMQGDILQR